VEHLESPDHNKQKFLARIGAQGIQKYENIDKLFVPPNNYADVKNALQEDKVVFITGTKEYGKTYTAIRLLWEYFGQTVYSL
jgi:hypothetical protein